MIGVEKFRDTMPWTVTTELLIYQGHRFKTFGYWDSRTAKGAATKLIKILKRAEKILSNSYVRPDQRKDHLKKISYAIAAAPSCLTMQLDAFGLDLRYLVKLALRMEAAHIHICLMMVIWLLEEHELWRSPNNAILHIMGNRQFSERVITQIDKAINEDPDAEWSSPLDPMVLPGLVADLEETAEKMLRRKDKRAEDGVRKAFMQPGIYKPVWEVHGDWNSIFKKTALELWTTIQNTKEWDAIERLYIASTTANFDLEFSFSSYLEKDHFKLWSLIFPKQEKEEADSAAHSRQDFGSWLKHIDVERRAKAEEDPEYEYIPATKRNMTPEEWVDHCAEMRDWYRRERIARRMIYQRPSGADTPVGITPKSTEDPRAWSSEAITMDLDQQMQIAELNESKDSTVEMHQMSQSKHREQGPGDLEAGENSPE